MYTAQHRAIMNLKAEPFVPESKKQEDAMFDELEKQFVKNNPWIFKYADNMEFEYKLEKQFNENTVAPPSTPVSKKSPMKRKLDEVDYSDEAEDEEEEQPEMKETQKKMTYADIVKSSK